MPDETSNNDVVLDLDQLRGYEAFLNHVAIEDDKKRFRLRKLVLDTSCPDGVLLADLLDEMLDQKGASGTKRDIDQPVSFVVGAKYYGEEDKACHFDQFWIERCGRKITVASPEQRLTFERDSFEKTAKGERRQWRCTMIMVASCEGSSGRRERRHISSRGWYQSP